MTTPDLITPVFSSQCLWAQQKCKQYYHGKTVRLYSKPLPVKVMNDFNC